MLRYLKIASGVVYALLVAGSLTVGARAALARPVGARDCRYDPPAFLGACASQQDCDNACHLEGGYQGQCLGGCCRCLL